MNKAVNLSDQQKKILGYGVVLFIFLIMGVPLLFGGGNKNITENDVAEVQITFSSIKEINAGDGDYRYTLHSADDDRIYNISNVLQRDFRKNDFMSYVREGDALVLKVLKKEYESKKNPVTVLGITGGGRVFMDYEAAFDRYRSNYKGTVGIGIAFISIGIAGAVYLSFYIKKAGDPKRKSRDDFLSMYSDGDKLIIKFPPRLDVLIFISLVCIATVILPFFIREGINRLLEDSNTFRKALIICTYIYLIINNTGLFLLLFLRKLTIDREKGIISYFSFYKRTFRIEEISGMSNRKVEDAEGLATYWLEIRTSKKIIKVKTQSDAQSLALEYEINLCTEMIEN